MKVRLTPEDFREAAQGGHDRTAIAYLRGLKRPGCPVYGRWEDSIRGALGEMAVCRAFNFTWDPTVGRTDAPDAGPFQVRTTHWPDGKLILRGAEVESHEAFILVTGDGLDYVIHGWIMGRAGKREQWLYKEEDPRPGGGPREPAYRVPQSALWRLEDLPLRSAAPSLVQKVGNFPTPAGVPADLEYCPVCWQPETLSSGNRILPPEHDAHKHALSRG